MTIKRIQAYTLAELIDKANELAGKFADKRYSSDIPADKWANRAAEKAKQFVTEAVLDCDLTCSSSENWAAMTADLQKMYRAAMSDESLIDHADANEYLFAADGTPIHHLIEEEETQE